MMSKYFATGYSDLPMEKKDIIRELVYTQADLLLPAKNAVVMKPIGVIDFKYDIPKITSIRSQKVAEGTRAGRKHMEFWQKPVSLDKYQTDVILTYESKARQLGSLQTSMTVNAVATGMAQDIDDEIMSSLVAATGQVATAAAKWNTAAASPAQDLATILGKIFDNTNIMADDLSNVQVYVPSKVWSFLKMPKDVNMLLMTVKTWMEKEQEVTLFPTRSPYVNAANGALVVLPGEQTAHHLTYNGTDIPTAEEEIEAGVGIDYIVTRYYKTVVIPDAVRGTTTSRLGWISGVC